MYKKIALLVFVSMVAGSLLHGQTLLDKEVRLNNFTGTTSDVLDQISKEGGFTFAYGNQIDINRKVAIEAGTGTIRTWLDKIFGLDKIEYVVNQNKIILRLKNKAKTTGSN